LSVDMNAVQEAVARLDPELIICPFLRERVPDEVWKRRRTIIIHPGPLGDRGASSLDWAITEGAQTWGVTALQAVAELDAGPVWAHRTFSLPRTPQRKSALYNGAVADAALDIVREVVAKASVRTFTPHVVEQRSNAVSGRTRPTMRQADRAFSWYDDTDHIVRRIRAADGSPGVRTVLRGEPVYVYDAHPGTPLSGGGPGTIAARRHGAVLVRTGDSAVWIGHIRLAPSDDRMSIKLPATVALSDHIGEVPELLAPLRRAHDHTGFRDIYYERRGSVGRLSFDFYNGAMSTVDCRRLTTALRHATAQDTRVLVLRGGETFSNGIHLSVIEAAGNPATEAWHNINAIDDLCREIITCTPQLVITAVGGNAGAGGVMLALGADRVLLRENVVLNPHYRTMGLFGSEYWTYVLPRRVGEYEARRLTEQCLPISSDEAASLGLVDQVVPGAREQFDNVVAQYATALAASPDYVGLVEKKAVRRTDDERRRPLDSYRAQELGEMSRDIYTDRFDFSALRRAFVTKRPRFASGASRPLRAGRGSDHRMSVAAAL
ncbi:MAG: formyl transferase, partial [Candidatus Eremiobacteraeota bacterium]|nr:formyl transferase [Candidatus Eremiobacteraeota bacterium]MBV9263025.1 formyl transferase [Candidatus Eremiobacteraeota bacterium]